MVAQIDNVYKALPKKFKLRRFISYLFFEGRPLTTRGRFINKPLALLYNCLKYFRCTGYNYKVVHVLGTGRSGTTILGVSLSTHINVGFLNEPKLPWSCAYNNEDIIGSYRENVGKYVLDSDDYNERTDFFMKSFYGFYSKLLGVDTIVDKYPEMIFRVSFLDSLSFDSKYIFLYRNGLDIVNSITSWSKRKGISSDGATYDWWGLNDRKWILLVREVVSKDDLLSPHINEIAAYNNHNYRAAVEWIVTMRTGLKLSASMPSSKFFSVRYESFVESETVREDLLTFLKLPKCNNFSQYCSQALKSPNQQPNLSFNQNQVLATAPHLSRFHSIPSMLITFWIFFKR